MHGNMLRLLAIVIVGFLLVVLIGLLVPVSPGPESMSRGARMVIDALIQILQGGVAIPLTAFAHAAITLYYLRIREETLMTDVVLQTDLPAPMVRGKVRDTIRPWRQRC